MRSSVVKSKTEETRSAKKRVSCASWWSSNNQCSQLLVRTGHQESSATSRSIFAQNYQIRVIHGKLYSETEWQPIGWTCRPKLKWAKGRCSVIGVINSEPIYIKSQASGVRKRTSKLLRINFRVISTSLVWKIFEIVFETVWECIFASMVYSSFGGGRGLWTCSLKQYGNTLTLRSSV